MINFGFTLLRQHQLLNQPLVCILPTAIECENALAQLKFFTKGMQKNIVYLPSYELNEEDNISPSPHIIATRVHTLSKIHQGQFDIALTSVDAIIRQLPPVDFVQKSIFNFHVGQVIEPHIIIKQLVQSGFNKQSQVDEPMSFAHRGEILDIFLPQLSHPIRIIFDDEIIESIMRFDSQTQRSESEVKQISISPGFEYHADEAKLLIHQSSPLYPPLQQNNLITAWQQHLNQLHPKLATICDYIPPSAQLVCFDHLQPLMIDSIQRSSSRLEKINLLSDDLLIHDHAIQNIHLNIQRLTPQSNSIKQLFTIKDKEFKKHLSTLAAETKVLISCQNHYRYHELEQVLLTANIAFTPVDSWIAFSSQDINLGICMGYLDHITEVPDLNQCLIPEHSLSEQIITEDKAPKQRHFISHSTLKEGDFLVHEDHGVGRFIGIETRTIAGTEQDMVAIEYANHDKLLFLPHLLYKIHPYYGHNTQLDQLKSDRWQKRKKKALENIEQFAASLLQESASRQKHLATPIDLPEEYKAFTDAFPFTDTADQHNIMQEIIEDLRQNILFDRLVCGDVGFGKTEIALRTAFIASMNGYQVLVLAPTTVLANQHFQTFKDRFKDWPMHIKLLTRAQNHTTSDIETGKTDIIIGTHKALNIQYKKLGLVIIDEEHRFGVKQKDNIKAFRHTHRLSLTATPIPRSLNMALSKFRKISMMHEPPKKRLPIITYIGEEDQQVIRSAIEREIRRGGQVYILVNDVQRIPEMIQKLEKIYPYASFGALHGQMHTDAIERQMARFHAQSFQVLVASTIIEAGIDIPNANTLIVFRADKLGLAQMHQLRGRIGRSHHQGFAYFLTPKNYKISSDAQMRLDAIKSHTSLGAGIKLALADLEIRGAGNLLGSEQSGHVNAVGIAMYTALLNKALPSKDSQHFTTEVKTNLSCIIPETYVEQSALRYEFYHRIANTQDEKEIIDISDELTDRFGKMPTQTLNLVHIERLQKISSSHCIKSIQITESHFTIHYGEQSIVNTDVILKLIKTAAAEFCGPNSIKSAYKDEFFIQLKEIIQQTAKRL
jgi:transcription-repair coupling factor (superfamily II helicase)